MRRGGGKNKGASFEREICVLLSKWISNGTDEGIFWRSAMSGGRATVRLRKGHALDAQAGDISAVKSAGEEFITRFCAECKFYRDLEYRSAIVGKGHLVNFWTKLKAEAKQYGKYPILFAKQNQMPIFVGVDEYGRNLLGLDKAVAHVIYPRERLHLYQVEVFLRNSTPVVSPHYVPSDRRPSLERKRERRLPVRDL